MENKKKNSIYVVVFLEILLTTFAVYSCSTDEYNYTNETVTGNNLATKTHDFSSQTGNNLIDSIASSDEFWEFEISCELLSDKFHNYTSKLSKEEHDELMENLNDDDYVEAFIKGANLDKELQQLKAAKENLIQHTKFLSLSEDERKLLFQQYAKSRNLKIKTVLKTRTEGDKISKCEEQKQAAYAEAKADYDNAITTNCKGAGPISSCYIIEASKYNANKRIADREYENCINKQ